MSAARLSPIDYPATPEDGILEVCRLSDEVLALSKTFSESRSPEDVILFKLADGRPGAFDDVLAISDNAQVRLDLDYIRSGPELLGLQSKLHYVLISAKRQTTFYLPLPSL
jgi:hypothetical protein